MRFMTPYLDSHDDLSGAVFLSLVGFWELERNEVPADYLEVRLQTHRAPFWSTP